MLLRTLRTTAIQQLQQQGKDNANLDVTLMLSQVLHLTKVDIILQADRSITEEEETQFQQLLSQRLRGRPLSQILHHRDFWRSTFYVNDQVLTPRPDSETLVELVLELVPLPTAKLQILELGVGSGCLLLSLLQEFTQAQGYGIDLSETALAVASHNAQQLELTSRVTWLQADLAVWLRSAPNDTYDLIISNPPYIPTEDITQLAPEVQQFEPHLALDGGTDGLDFYRLFATYLKPLLAPQGKLLLECGQHQASAIMELFDQAGGWRYLTQKADLAGIPRVLAFSSLSPNTYHKN